MIERKNIYVSNDAISVATKITIGSIQVVCHRFDQWQTVIKVRTTQRENSAI